MSSESSRKSWSTYKASTIFLRIPRFDWPSVTTGEKTEFRAAGRHALAASRITFPVPVVGYTVWEHKPKTSRLLLLEHADTEPLGAISEESLAAEGFGDLEEIRASSDARHAAMTEFRRYWKARHPSTGYRPLSKVYVYRVRPLTEDERPEMGLRLLGLLYDGYL